MIQLSIPDYLRSGDNSHGGVVLFHIGTGRWHVLNGTGGDFWRCWQGGADLEEAVAEIVHRYPQTSPDRIRADGEHLLNQLVARGLLDVRLPKRGQGVARSESRTRELMTGQPRAELMAGQLRSYLLIALAFFCVSFAVICARLPFSLSYRLVTSLRKRGSRTRPTPQRAAAIVAAVHLVGRWYPGRAACLEQSLASVLLAELFRHRLDWCLGAVSDPYRFHAWVEVGGEPVLVPNGADEQVNYVRVLKV